MHIIVSLFAHTCTPIYPVCTTRRDKPVIFNTFQCYLTDSSERVRIDLERAKRENWKFACKLVRGAYMIQVCVCVRI